MATSSIRTEFEQLGYRVDHDVFSKAEVEAFRREIAWLSTQDTPQRVLESESTVVRSLYAVHESSELFGRLARDPRLLDLAKGILDDDVYLHQSQLNPKAAFHGEVWDWHQDFVIWSRDDGMPEPRAINVSVTIDDVNEFNGPLFVVPGSHLASLEDFTAAVSTGWEGNIRAAKHVVDRAAIEACVSERGMASMCGAAGSVLTFDSNILHCSAPNLSPWPRTILFFRYNAVSNALRPVDEPRPWWFASRDPRPLQPLEGPLLVDVVEMTEA
ncbi:phytanoyl-CoA dioxygenase family protein [Nonomuraea sp. K274]|uniref:Phytanoyl-CoA dioxygenase family protein n=1 Tax=Nonomuraea cypriaca TaxID=1187855 RepID=A0A931A8C6_9ACTN|nr:phytanoyl-CoA dioxygenase family protein [Nonomuraea cypriaca]MBF8187063.1 phytanoyl-CoA dioxygenase family protein [Nonomuraea cypriaca]